MRNESEKPKRLTPGTRISAAEKMARIPVKIENTGKPARKPDWIRVRAPVTPAVKRLKEILRENKLHTVCEEATCPNITECFGKGTATFMIMGDICTRRCPFCDVAHGRPAPLDTDEPQNLAKTVKAMGLNYVVVTSVDRDDLRDGGARHFAECIAALRGRCPDLRIEVLVPDFRGRMGVALDILEETPPDVFNHNLETVHRLYRAARPGADYAHSLELIRAFKARRPDVLTKSGLMVGLGEEISEIHEVMADLRSHDCDMITIGQYLQPTRHHLAVERFLAPDEFNMLADKGYSLGFQHVASGPLVRSSYHADEQATGLLSDKTA